MKESVKRKRARKPDFGHEKISLLYEDTAIAVISKPSGMLSVPYPGSSAKTALGALEKIMRKNGTWSARHRPFAVHRLDRDTSGVMMFAMSERARLKIMAAWHKMVTERLYRAVAENPADGALPSSGIIDDEIAYNKYNMGFVPSKDDKPSKIPKRKNSGERKTTYERHLKISGGKASFKTVKARTHFKVIERGPTHTLFELSLDTGKKNQIRAHLASKGCPIAGDENCLARTDPFGRLALHARTLEFFHPVTKEKMRFEEPESDEWISYVRRGDENPEAPAWRRGKRPAREKGARREKKIDMEKLVSSRVGGKKLSRMSYIERGKLLRR